MEYTKLGFALLKLITRSFALVWSVLTLNQYVGSLRTDFFFFPTLLWFSADNNITFRHIFLFSCWTQSAAEYLEEVVLSEQKATSELSYTVSGVLSSSDVYSTSRSENLKKLLEGDEKYTIYKFNPRQAFLTLEFVLWSLHRV